MTARARRWNAIRSHVTDIDVLFSRRLLAQIAPIVRKVGKRPMRDAWVWNAVLAGRNHWEFHGPNEFYWYGYADNAYEARYHGWSAWLAKHHPETLESMS